MADTSQDAYNRYLSANISAQYSNPLGFGVGQQAQSYDQWVQSQGGPDPVGTAQALLDAQRLKQQQEQERIDNLKKQGLNADGSPIAPDYSNPIGTDGQLQSGYQISPWQTVNANTQGLDQLRSEALRGAGNNSAWANLALQKQQLGQDQAMDNAAAGSNNASMAAQTQLAQTGGLDGSARERMLGQASQNGFIQRQQVGRQGLLDRAAILAQDETQRQTGLRDLQTADNQQADIQFKNQQQSANNQQYNTTNLFKANDSQNQYNLDKYKQQMSVWGAGKQADAQKGVSSGGKK
jgi:hypothetical protein